MKNLEELFASTASAQATSPAPGAKGGMFGMFLPMILVFGIFYFLMIRPQAKQRKLHLQMIQALKKGDEVVTSAGIHGKIYALADNVVTLEVAENIRFKLERQQITTVKPVTT